ncbi:hypothetical protein [Thermobrachium celere]|uniref:hypothetical protein n=1 Tax=Thermobrachium celere TaxID=53422 RepID=UPI00194278E9|nr:hypothetical protein [Thermobrachium celere]GFR35458.1 hypothetical protein TCEA9_12700 [Thermobrachium celere]
MVHTAYFIKKLTIRDIRYIEHKFNKAISIAEIDINQRFQGIITKFIKKQKNYYVQVHIDFIKLLNKANINNSDYLVIDKKINKYMGYVFGKDIGLTLIRIDYRFDVVLPKNVRNVLLKIYKKNL